MVMALLLEKLPMVMVVIPVASNLGCYLGLHNFVCRKVAPAACSRAGWLGALWTAPGEAHNGSTIGTHLNKVLNKAPNKAPNRF